MAKAGDRFDSVCSCICIIIGEGEANGVESTPSPLYVHFAPSVSIMLSFIFIEFLNLRSSFIVFNLYTAFIQCRQAA